MSSNFSCPIAIQILSHLFFGGLLQLLLLLLAAGLLPGPMAAPALQQQLHGPVLVPPRVEESRSDLVFLFSRYVHHLLDLSVLLLRVLVAADDLKRNNKTTEQV